MFYKIYHNSIKTNWPVFILSIAGLIFSLVMPIEYIFHSDTILYTRAIDKFDPTIQQPQPPGYFFYILLARLINTIINDAHQALLILSSIGFALSIITIFYLAKSIFNKRVAYISSLILLCSPIFLFYSLVAQPYSFESFLVIFLLYFCYQNIVYPSVKNLILSTVFLGVLGGFRQQDILFLFPVWLFSLRTYDSKKIFRTSILLMVIIFSWLLPTFFLSHGINNYVHALSKQSASFSGTPVFQGGVKSLIRNFTLLINALSVGLGLFFLISVLHYIFSAVARILSVFRNFKLKNSIRQQYFDKSKILFFCLAIFPSLLFYLLIHINNPGHIMTFLPPLIVAIAYILFNAWENIKNKLTSPFLLLQISIQQFLRYIGIYIMVFVSFLNFAIFLFSPSYISYFNGLRNHDYLLSKELSIVREKFAPQDTLVTVISQSLFLGFNHASYYLNEYKVFEFYRDPAIDYPAASMIRIVSNNQVTYSDYKNLFQKGKTVVFFNGCERDFYTIIRNKFPNLEIKGIRIADGCYLYYAFNQ